MNDSYEMLAMPDVNGLVGLHIATHCQGGGGEGLRGPVVTFSVVE